MLRIAATIHATGPARSEPRVKRRPPAGPAEGLEYNALVLGHLPGGHGGNGLGAKATSAFLRSLPRLGSIMLRSVNPATGEQIERFEEFTAKEIDAALSWADAAFHDWRGVARRVCLLR